MPIKKFFDDVPIKPLPPDARRWSLALKHATEHGHQAFCRLDRERDGLVFKVARLFLFIRNRGKDVDVLDAPWNQALHDWLVREKVPAETPQNEAERFGFALKDKFAPIELRFGDGFFSAVLVHFLRDQGFDEAKSTKEMLGRIHESHGARGEHATICAEMIDDAITATADDLKRLGYPEGAREDVLAAAIAYYLDERFSITNGRLLGFC
jgi:hypothetical protein